MRCPSCRGVPIYPPCIECNGSGIVYCCEGATAQARGYTIAPDGGSITCHHCGRTSHHPRDVDQRYCGFCHIFH